MSFKQICKLFCIVIPWTAIYVLALFAITCLTKTIVGNIIGILITTFLTVWILMGTKVGDKIYEWMDKE